MKIRVFKIGGNVVDNPSALEGFATDFAKISGPKVLIHGGGALASRMQKNLGSEPVMIAGRRVTDEETLKIVTIGLSGADGGLVKADRRPPVMVEQLGKTVDYGRVGDIRPDGIDNAMICRLLKAGLTPVFCAITYDGKGGLLNTNADTVASAIAVSLSRVTETELVYCFEKDGVLLDKDDENSLIPSIDPEYFEKLKADGIVADGMLPKLENAFKAIAAGVGKVTIKNSCNISNDRQTVLLGK